MLLSAVPRNDSCNGLKVTDVGVQTMKTMAAHPLLMICLQQQTTSTALLYSMFCNSQVASKPCVGLMSEHTVHQWPSQGPCYGQEASTGQTLDMSRDSTACLLYASMVVVSTAEQTYPKRFGPKTQRKGKTEKKGNKRNSYIVKSLTHLARAQRCSAASSAFSCLLSTCTSFLVLAALSPVVKMS